MIILWSDSSAVSYLSRKISLVLCNLFFFLGSLLKCLGLGSKMGLLIVIIRQDETTEERRPGIYRIMKITSA